MRNRRSLNRQTAVCGELSAEDPGELSREGFASVLDVRSSMEAEAGLSADEERLLLAGAGVEYCRVPTSDRWLDPNSLETFAEALSRLSTPVLVHCQTGSRAGLLTLASMGARNGWSADETLARARALGIPCESPSLEEAIRSYLDKQNRRDLGYCSVG